MKPICKLCGTTFAKARRQAGYTLCLTCGDKQASQQTRTIVPMHKSNYMYLTDESAPELLKGINNKGGKHGL